MNCQRPLQLFSYYSLEYNCSCPFYSKEIFNYFAKKMITPVQNQWFLSKNSWELTLIGVKKTSGLEVDLGPTLKSLPYRLAPGSGMRSGENL